MFCRLPRSLLVLIFCTAFFASACGDPPTREMDQAQGAIDAARAAGADRYATEEYRAAVEALKQAQEAVTQRDYRLALNHAIDSRERAQNAAKDAAGQQATLRSGAERRLGEVTAVLAQANQRLAAAEASRVPHKSLAAVRATMASADVSLQKAGTKIESGDYQASQAQLSDTAALIKGAMAGLDGLMSGRGVKPRR
jgi:Domain of unknown function (DUF4398)